MVLCRCNSCLVKFNWTNTDMFSEVRRMILTKQIAYYWLSQIPGNNKKIICDAFNLINFVKIRNSI
jgi:hypothetical protein